MLDPKLAEHKAICYTSLWRALPDGPHGQRPTHYISLIQDEVAELVATGGFTLPDHLIPESVRAWRKTQETAVEIVAGKIPKLAEGGIIEGDHLAIVGEQGPEAIVPLEATRV